MYIRFSLFCFGLLLLFICCIVEIFKIEIILVVFTICGCCAKVACTITYFKREWAAKNRSSTLSNNPSTKLCPHRYKCHR